MDGLNLLAFGFIVLMFIVSTFLLIAFALNWWNAFKKGLSVREAVLGAVSSIIGIAASVWLLVRFVMQARG